MQSSDLNEGNRRSAPIPDSFTLRGNARRPVRARRHRASGTAVSDCGRSAEANAMISLLLWAYRKQSTPKRCGFRDIPKTTDPLDTSETQRRWRHGRNPSMRDQLLQRRQEPLLETDE